MAATNLPMANPANRSEELRSLVQDGRLLFELGKLDEAEAKLKAAAKLEPENKAVHYYLNLIEENRSARTSDWSKGRQKIMQKLEAIRINEVFFDNLPLTAVLKALKEDVEQRDPDKIGINFHLDPYSKIPAVSATFRFKDFPG